MKMKKSLWFFIGLGTNLVVSSSIIASCGHNVKTPADDPLNYDQKFGFNQATYEKLEEQFKDQLAKKIENEDKHAKPGEEQDKWDEKIKELGGKDKIERDLQKSLDNFRTNFFTESGAFYSSSFNAKTETLINFAKQNYDINLNRTVDKQVLENEKDEIKQSYLNYLTQSWEIACKDDPEKATKINDKIGEFKQKFDTWYDEVKQDCNDEATILNKLRIKLIDYIGGVNDELVRLSTQNQLRDSLSAHKFEVKLDSENKSDKDFLWEKLNNPNNEFNPSSGPKQLSNSFFDKFFDIFDANNTNIFADNDTEPKKYNGLSDISISGYTLTPYIANLEADPLKNEYYVDLDWQLVNENVYKEKLEKYTKLHNGDEEAAKNDEKFIAEVDYITAHSYADLNEDGQEPVLQNTLKEKSTQNRECSTSYLWPISVKYGRETLFNTFIHDSENNKNKISFSWLNDEKINGYDTFYSFYDAQTTQSVDVEGVDVNSLANCGLQINGRTITDIAKEMETNSDEEIENDPAKLCLKYCDLSAIYKFTNPQGSKKERKIDAIFGLTYPSNKKISCNPLITDLDYDEKDEWYVEPYLHVDNCITERMSGRAYQLFAANYKFAMNVADLDVLDKCIDQATYAALAVVGLATTLIVIIVILIAFAIKSHTLGIQLNPDGKNKNWEDNIIKSQEILMIVLSVALIGLTVASAVFISSYLAELNEYKKNVDNFKTNSGHQSQYKFIDYLDRYRHYYESEASFRTGFSIDHFSDSWDALGYFNNIENNQDFKDYKQARKDAKAWEVREFSDLVFNGRSCAAIACLLLAIVLAVLLLKLVLQVYDEINAKFVTLDKDDRIPQNVIDDLDVGAVFATESNQDEGIIF